MFLFGKFAFQTCGIVIKLFISLQSFDCSDIPLLLTNVHEDLQSFVLLNGNTSKVPLNTVNSGQLAATFVYFRVFAEIPISFDRTSQGIKQALEDIKTKV